jgi:uracil-DNA glycosylase
MLKTKINTSIPFFEELADLLNEQIIDLEIRSVYEHWNTFLSTGEPLPKEEIVKSAKKLLRHEKQCIPSNACLLGVDLPSWFGDFKSKNRIMVIGIDPMRGSKDFKIADADEMQHVIIGTPYALHDNKNRDWAKRNKHYFGFIDAISSENFVYLTDIYKTFFYTNESNDVKKRSYKYYNDADKENIEEKNSVRNSVLNALCQEIELVKPNIIVTLGGISFSQLTNKSITFKNNPKIEKVHFTENMLADKKDIDILPFVHLAAHFPSMESFIKNNLNKQLKKGENENYGTLYYEILKKYLK